jgi:hypothetical protein
MDTIPEVIVTDPAVPSEVFHIITTDDQFLLVPPEVSGQFRTLLPLIAEHPQDVYVPFDSDKVLWFLQFATSPEECERKDYNLIGSVLEYMEPTSNDWFTRLPMYNLDSPLPYERLGRYLRDSGTFRLVDDWVGFRSNSEDGREDALAITELSILTAICYNIHRWNYFTMWGDLSRYLSDGALSHPARVHRALRDRIMEGRMPSLGSRYRAREEVVDYGLEYLHLYHSIERVKARCLTGDIRLGHITDRSMYMEGGVSLHFYYGRDVVRVSEPTYRLARVDGEIFTDLPDGSTKLYTLNYLANRVNSAETLVEAGMGKFIGRKRAETLVDQVFGSLGSATLLQVGVALWESILERPDWTVTLVSILGHRSTRRLIFVLDHIAKEVLGDENLSLLLHSSDLQDLVGRVSDHGRNEDFDATKEVNGVTH